MFHLDSPWALLLLILFPFFLEKETRYRLFPKRKVSGEERIEEAALAFSSPVQLSALAKRSGSRIRLILLNTFRLLTFALLVFALSRPQTGTEFTEIETAGRDIMITLDISGSMQALDYFIERQRVNRLTALKSVVKEFVEARKGDRMGLIIFGTDVFTQCPLTVDFKVVSDFVERLDFGMVGDGTALGDAIALSVKRLREIPGDSKVIVLVTDGLKTAGSIEPKEAAEIAKKAKIKVYTIGIGGTGPAPFPVTNVFGQTSLHYENVPLDVETLQKIADVTGGKFFRAEKTDSLRNVYQEINRLEERIDHQSQFIDYQEHFQPFLLAAIGCFLVFIAIRVTKYLVVP